MGNDSIPVKLTGTGTTTPCVNGSAFLYGICINKTLTGTLTVNENGTAIGAFAVGTTPGTYHAIPNGGRFAVLTLVLSAGDDVTIYVRKAS